MHVSSIMTLSLKRYSLHFVHFPDCHPLMKTFPLMLWSLVPGLGFSHSYKIPSLSNKPRRHADLSFGTFFARLTKPPLTPGPSVLLTTVFPFASTFFDLLFSSQIVVVPLIRLLLHVTFPCRQFFGFFAVFPTLIIIFFGKTSCATGFFSGFSPSYCFLVRVFFFAPHKRSSSGDFCEFATSCLVVMSLLAHLFLFVGTDNGAFFGLFRNVGEDLPSFFSGFFREYPGLFLR